MPKFGRNKKMQNKKYYYREAAFIVNQAALICCKYQQIMSCSLTQHSDAIHYETRSAYVYLIKSQPLQVDIFTVLNLRKLQLTGKTAIINILRFFSLIFAWVHNSLYDSLAKNMSSQFSIFHCIFVSFTNNNN